jgi:ribosome biogenesis GTPase A
MSQDYCRGCGSALQTVDPNAPGYVPESAMQKRKQLTCQRCYRITHYGDAGSMQPAQTQIRRNLQKAFHLSQLVVLMIDFADITGTLPVWADYLEDKPYVLVVNKSDLLPSRTKFEEVQTFLEAYLRNLRMRLPQRMVMVSALDGFGVAVLAQQLSRLTEPGSKIALVGVTNVGKSSLIKQFLKDEQSAQTPTVSKIPGTTMGLSNWSILKGRNTLIDTPGLVTGDRAGDLLCPACGSRLVATAKMTRKLWGIKPGKGLIVGGLLGMELLGEAESVLIAFTGLEVTTHRTDRERVREILSTNPDWLKGICKKCLSKVEWEEFRIDLDPGFDFAVAGLGWLSLRGGSAAYRVILPRGIRFEIRPGIVGKK